MQPKVTLALAFLIITLLSSAQALDVALTSQTVVGNILFESALLTPLICIIMIMFALMI